MTERPSLAVLPIAVRQAAWDRTWQRLLASATEPEPPPEDKENAAGSSPAAREEAA